MSQAATFATFFLVANPMTYALTSRLPIVGDFIADSRGRPTQVGVLIHALVFVFLLKYLSKFF